MFVLNGNSFSIVDANFDLIGIRIGGTANLTITNVEYCHVGRWDGQANLIPIMTRSPQVANPILGDIGEFSTNKSPSLCPKKNQNGENESVPHTD
jgi:hypothetical protein